jgi:hypothetical protein
MIRLYKPEKYTIRGVELHRYSYRLLEIIGTMHYIVTGASDSEGKEESLLLLEFAKTRLRTWRPSIERKAKFDALLKDLLELTITEFEAWIKEYTPWDVGGTLREDLE